MIPEINHPIFAKFKLFDHSNAKIPDGFTVDIIGSMIDVNFWTYDEIKNPIYCEYIEWVQLLEAVDNAKGSFVFVELGAGFGRWSVRAWLAARQKGVTDIHVVAVEAEPAHLGWLKEHFRTNGLREDEYSIFPGVVGGSDGSALFYVRMPPSNEMNNAREWYGQSVIKEHEVIASHHPITYYHGKKVVSFASGWEAIEVPRFDINKVLDRHKRIDIMDVDIQGDELDVVKAAARQLKSRVKRLHLATHSKEIENELRYFLKGEGWTLIDDYTCFEENDTPFGRVKFVDGAQSWLNDKIE